MTRSTPSPRDRPTRLGDYFICSQLGAGGFGTVYLAFDQAHGRPVALKLPRPVLLDSEDAVERFLREAGNLERLQHPGIVPVYDAGRLDGLSFIALEYIEGTTLADPQARKRLTPIQVALLMADVAEALEHAHEQGVIHRDIKPSNVLLDLEGRPHLTDFGLAAWEGEPTVEWLRNAGTPEYMAPEQLAGQQSDRRSDVYSLGLTLYELLCGHRAFRADSVTELVDLIRNVEPKPPRIVKPEVPRELERICLKAIAKRPEQRYGSACEVAQELRAAAQMLAEPPAPRMSATVQTLAERPAPRMSAAPARTATSGAVEPGAAHLTVRRGPNQGAKYALNGDKTVLGRNADCGVPINTPAVSREHAVIHCSAGAYFIEDLKSRNGTYVNNQEVTARRELRNGDQIKICDNLYEFQESFVASLPDELRSPGDYDEDEDAASSVITARSGFGGKLSLEAQPAERLAFLLDITAELTQTFDVEQLLPKIADRIFQVFRSADRCFVILSEEGTSRLIPRVIKTRRGPDDGTARFSKRIVQKCLESNEAILSEDATADKRFDLSQSIADCKIRSVMVAPLVSRTSNKAFGVIQLDTQDRTKKFNADDLKLLMAVTGQAAIALDNTRIHQLTLKQQLDKVMEQRNMALTTVHSLRQPVMAIHGALMRLEFGLLERNLGPEGLLDAVRDASRSLTRTQEIITGILRFIRPPQVNRLRVDLGELARRVVADFETLNRRIQVQSALIPDAMVVGDSELIRQALEELMNNAARATQGSGEVQVRARKMKLEDGDLAVRVEVEDSGPGIAPEVRDQLFQPYVTTHAEGKGLGLVFVKYVIEQHGGHVWFEDASPCGARFVLQLPLAKGAADA